MAISKTVELRSIQVSPKADASADTSTNNANPTLYVAYTHRFDDSGDSTLPVSTTQTISLSRYVETTDSEGEITLSATDISSQDDLVKAVCAAVWV